MVRVGGFSAKFVALDPALQDDIINRYRHKA
jgi:pyruvate-formate lyase